MKYFALCTLKKSGRNSPPISSYGAGQVGGCFILNQVTTSFGGSSFGGSAGGASSGPAAPVVAIISESNNAPGTLGDNSDFDNSFESENGIRQESSGSTVSIGEDSVVVMKGSYEYIGDDGQTYVVDWIADENAVEAQIAFAAQEDAATGGSSFNGGFQGQSSGFQGQSSGFQGQSSGFQGQSSGFSGLGQQNFASSNQVQSSAPLTSYGG
ncbi:unnamed protein product [Lepeophtheirus salmonis]|uniref:(salmon louse) hypothetical protein n=1 Tax=Lepeophtheirus salmonis TaxID=72036 RepID=A0A7R8CLW8_LEPSM|nr:unnamed protein product [Lepeophtheirus salmonis]CAF2860322.1 unnamed protein product [Lepeophtheirus salmonis]